MLLVTSHSSGGFTAGEYTDVDAISSPVPLRVDASAASARAVVGASRPASSIPAAGGGRGMVVGGGGTAATDEVGGDATTFCDS